MNVSLPERELDILEAIHNRRHIKQRDLAHILGISVGMTNAIVRRLAQKGLLTIRKVNNRNIRYAVSAEGMDALTKRSVRYLKSTIRNVVDSKQAVEELVVAIKRLGYEEICLVGPSALDFVVEHVAGKYGLDFRQAKEPPGKALPKAPPPEPATVTDPSGPPEVDGGDPMAYFLFSESFEEPADHHRESHGYLRTILSSKSSATAPAGAAVTREHHAGTPR